MRALVDPQWMSVAHHMRLTTGPGRQSSGAGRDSPCAALKVSPACSASTLDWWADLCVCVGGGGRDLRVGVEAKRRLFRLIQHNMPQLKP